MSRKVTLVRFKINLRNKLPMQFTNRFCNRQQLFPLLCLFFITAKLFLARFWKGKVTYISCLVMVCVDEVQAWKRSPIIRFLSCQLQLIPRAIRLNSSLHTQNMTEDSKYKAIVFYFNVGYFLCPILPSLELPVAAGDWKKNRNKQRVL